ncbi:MAG: hypothetical protein K2J73_04390, partial [Oscillospiraceae bacterium]|nr:hypothetical protein [Oscillospiraceae bacterium]
MIMLMNILTIIGTIISFIGLVISCFTLYKTSNVEKAVLKQKMIQGFINDYKFMHDDLNQYACSLENGDIKSQAFYEIHKCVKKLQHYSKIEKWVDGNEINDFVTFFDNNFSNLLNSKPNSDYINEFIKRLHSI